MKSIISTSLRFQQGSSDKEYHCSVVQSGDLYSVNFAYGRVGSTLTTGTKTKQPVSLDEAQKIFAKLVKSKTSKGYIVDGTSSPEIEVVSDKTVSGYLPSLLNPVSEAEAMRLILNPDFVLQEKKDGRRMMLAYENGMRFSVNRKGLVCPQFNADIEALPEGTVLDGEAVGSVFFAFDILKFKGNDTTAFPYFRRLEVLTGLFTEPQLQSQNTLRLVQTASTVAEKTALFEQCKKSNLEGVVLKNRNAPYVIGRPASGGDYLKYKFVETATCRVRGQNQQRSVSVEVHDGKKWVDVGNVTIPPNFDIPEPGDICEIRYLYAYKHGSLYQPVYLGKRDDVNEGACSIAQLKYKAENDQAA